MNRLGQIVTEKRTALGMTQEQAASAWGLTASAISMIEIGRRRRLYPDTLLRLSLGLGIPLVDLIRLTEGDGQKDGDG